MAIGITGPSQGASRGPSPGFGYRRVRTLCCGASRLPLMVPAHRASPHRATAGVLETGEQFGLPCPPAAAVVAHAGEDGASGSVRHGAWFSLTVCTLPQRSRSIRRNHDGKALNGSSSTSAPLGRLIRRQAAVGRRDEPCGRGRLPLARDGQGGDGRKLNRPAVDTAGLWPWTQSWEA